MNKPPYYNENLIKLPSWRASFSLNNSDNDKNQRSFECNTLSRYRKKLRSSQDVSKRPSSIPITQFFHPKKFDEKDKEVQIENSPTFSRAEKYIMDDNDSQKLLYNEIKDEELQLKRDSKREDAIISRISPAKDLDFFFRIPETFLDASKSENFLMLYNLIFSEDIPKTTQISASDGENMKSTPKKHIPIVCIEVIYRYDSTSFRKSKATNRGIISSSSKATYFSSLSVEEEFPRTTEKMLGFVFLVSNFNRVFFLPLADIVRMIPEEPVNRIENENFQIEYGMEVSLENRWKFIGILIESTTLTKLCFDYQRLLKPVLQSNPNVRPKNVIDPKIACWIYNPELHSYEFSNLIGTFLNEMNANERISSNIGHLSKDMLDCYRLWDTVKALLEKEELLEPFINQEMKIVPILARMEMEGIGFDPEELSKNKKKLEQHIYILSKKARKLLGHSISLSSPQQVSYAIFEELKIGKEINCEKEGHLCQRKSKLSIQTTKKHQYNSTSEKILLSLKRKHPFIPIVIEYRHCQKILSNWIESLERKAISIPFESTKVYRIHTTWTQTNTASGRLSSMNPNLQALPKSSLFISNVDDCESLDSESKEHSSISDPTIINIRDAFISKSGFCFLSFDYSQLEVRILAHMSCDTELLEFFNQGKDIHRLIASRWLSVLPEEVTDKQRDQAKRVVYGILYGMGAPSLAEILNVSISSAANFIDSFLSKFPGIAKFLENTITFAKKNKCVKTLFNRRRLLPDITGSTAHLKKRSERQAINSVVQGTAADIAKMAMIKVGEMTLENPMLIKNQTKLLLQIHDELVFETLYQEPDLTSVIDLLRQTIEKAASLRVPLPVKCSSGVRLGSLTARTCE